MKVVRISPETIKREGGTSKLAIDLSELGKAILNTLLESGYLICLDEVGNRVRVPIKRLVGIEKNVWLEVEGNCMFIEVFLNDDVAGITFINPSKSENIRYEHTESVRSNCINETADRKAIARG